MACHDCWSSFCAQQLPGIVQHFHGDRLALLGLSPSEHPFCIRQVAYQVVGHIPAPRVAIADAVVLVLGALGELLVVGLPAGVSTRLARAPRVRRPALLVLVLAFLRLLLPSPSRRSLLLPGVEGRLRRRPGRLLLWWLLGPPCLLLPRIRFPLAVPSLRLSFVW